MGSGGGVGISGAFLVSGGLVEGALAVLAAKPVSGVKAFICACLASIFLVTSVDGVICKCQGGFHQSTTSIWRGSIVFRNKEFVFLGGEADGSFSYWECLLYMFVKSSPCGLYCWLFVLLSTGHQ